MQNILASKIWRYAASTFNNVEVWIVGRTKNKHDNGVTLGGAHHQNIHNLKLWLAS